ncbi:MAG: VCBS repeat-containing protein, partial [Candidatus Aegiribacteria sp.]|nr:VCBS repeat-containing protein [Candidatus Aegiribacteria sp.]
MIIDVPPGGYAWSIYINSSEHLEFTTVSTFAPGPWSGIDDQALSEILTEPALEALCLTDEWLIPDLLVRFTDLLFEPVDVSSPVRPAFADVNGDAVLDLVLIDDEGVIHTYAPPNWKELQSSVEDIDFQVFCDINNDGLADSALISSDGTLTINSGGLPFMTASGFDFSAVTGVALSDMEGDGLADLVAGTESGKVLVFRNRGTVETPVFLPFSSESELFFPMNPGAFTIPVIYAVDDTTICLAAGTQQSGLKLYRLNSTQTYADEWVEMESVLSSEKLQNISPVAICSNGEIRLICCSRSGVLYEIISGPDSLQLLSLPPVPGTY